VISSCTQYQCITDIKERGRTDRNFKKQVLSSPQYQDRQWDQHSCPFLYLQSRNWECLELYLHLLMQVYIRDTEEQKQLCIYHSQIKCNQTLMRSTKIAIVVLHRCIRKVTGSNLVGENKFSEVYHICTLSLQEFFLFTSHNSSFTHP
jgi:hypothetical protein